MAPQLFWYWSAASLWNCRVRLMQQWAPAASLEKHNSTDHGVYVPSATPKVGGFFVLLLLGFRFWPSQLPVLPDTYSQRTCLALITSRCHIEGCEIPLLASSGCSPWLWGLPGKAPLPLLPAGAKVRASTLSNPISVVFYLHHLSP